MGRCTGEHRDNIPAALTPTAKETADITKAKAEAVISVFQAGLMGADTAQKELKRLADETGMFGSITDEEIAANAGKTYQDVTALRDPLAGLGFETLETKAAEEKAGAFESAVQDGATMDYNSNHDPQNGRFTSGSSGGEDKGTKSSTNRSRNAKVKLGKKSMPGSAVGYLPTIRCWSRGRIAHILLWGILLPVQRKWAG